jgi:hypothetical protein
MTLRRALCVLSLLTVTSACTPTMAVGDTSVTVAKQRWQHHCISEANPQSLNEAAMRFGREGWEMAAAASGPSGDRGLRW